jgi:hypothetical protein
VERRGDNDAIPSSCIIYPAPEQPSEISGNAANNPDEVDTEAFVNTSPPSTLSVYEPDDPVCGGGLYG